MTSCTKSHLQRIVCERLHEQTDGMGLGIRQHRSQVQALAMRAGINVLAGNRLCSENPDNVVLGPVLQFTYGSCVK